MSTRRLILTALLCGLAIVIAGGIKLFQVATDTKEVDVLALGNSVTVGDMTVSVSEISQTPEATLVTVTMVGVEDGDATDGWFLRAPSEPRPPVEVDGIDNLCTVTKETMPVTCVLSFEPSDGVVTVAYVRAEQVTQWSK